MASKPKKIWDNYKVVGEVQKSDFIKFVVAAGYRDGVKYINIREFYLRRKDNVWMPGRDGLTIPVLVPVNKGATLIKPYEVLGTLMGLTVDELELMPIEDEANAIWYTPKEDKA